MSLTLRGEKQPPTNLSPFRLSEEITCTPARVYAGSIFGSDPLKLCGMANWNAPTQGS